MQLSISKDANPNYLAQIVQLGPVAKHPNADRLQIVEVQNCTVITGLDAKEGDWYVYVPVESQLSSSFLSWSNSYSKSELNKDTKAKGMFGSNGRVKMLKIRSVYSNGYIFPYKVLQDFTREELGVKLKDIHPNVCFDTIGNHLFVWKYCVPIKEPQQQGQRTKGKVKKFPRLIPNMFAFHADTDNLRREVSNVQPTDYIAITAKMHGSNGIVANTLVNKKLSLIEKILKFFGFNIQDKEYGLVYSSRTVVKSNNVNPDSGVGWYGEDLWGIVAQRVFPKLDKGIRVTGEIIGWTPNGKAIQPKYDYGLPQGTCDFLVFKVDYVNPDGETFTFSHPQLVAYCEKKGFRMPETFFYGRAADLFPDLDTQNHWHENFLHRLEETYLGKRDSLCTQDVPAEGICIVVQVPLGWKAYKLKDLEFLGYETKILDAQEEGKEELGVE